MYSKIFINIILGIILVIFELSFIKGLPANGKKSFGNVKKSGEFNPSKFLDNLKNIVDKHNDNVKKQNEILKKIENEY